MIKFNKQTNTFDSMFQQHHINDISIHRMYQWIKTGEISLKDFNVWVEYKERASKQSFIDMF